MAVLLIMRHAKSDWSVGGMTDHERPLAPRGVEAAGAMGRFLARCGQAPELVFTSTAERARATAELGSTTIFSRVHKNSSVSKIASSLTVSISAT